MNHPIIAIVCAIELYVERDTILFFCQLVNIPIGPGSKDEYSMFRVVFINSKRV